MKPRDRQILQIALPSIVSNITVPLLGLIDVAIVGHLGSPAYIGAIAVGGMLFNIIYWIFGFLRMGTSGMTSQAFGKRNLPEVVCLLLRSVGIGVAVAFCLILLQTPIKQGAFLLIHPTDEVREMATLYFHICIWGAPAMLGLYGLTGWFIGMQNSRIPMYIAITECGQYHCQPRTGLSVWDESRRSSFGDVDCPVCWLPDGHCPLDAQLRQAEKILGN